MGPDHSQIEIYEESKHGMMFQAQERLMNLDAAPKQLTTRDMFVPTCATCHMSGINGLGVTHDPSERLSYYVANAITEKRPNFAANQAKMKQICAQCHTALVIDKVHANGEQVVNATNERVRTAQAIVDGLRKGGALSGPPFSNPIDFVYFDLWHCDGRTSKHGAFMGRSRLRAVAWQLSHAAENGSVEGHGRGTQEKEWQIQVSDGGVITSSGLKRSLF